jgi:TfoX C-terminal domain
VLTDRLRRADIMTAEQFLALGDAEAFARLVRVSPEDACAHTRLALAGAARGVRWHGLPPELRSELARGLSRWSPGGL